MAEQNYLEAIRKWVEIETPTGDLDGLARLEALMRAEYEALGASVEVVAGREGHGAHLIARVPAAKASANKGILVLSHYDTVHPRGTIQTFPLRVEGERAYGPGIYDMKASAWMAMQAIGAAHAEQSLSLPVTHLIVSDEEVGSPTSRDLILRLAESAEYVLVTEPAREGGQIVLARKGTFRYRVEIQGRPSHSGSRPQDGRSAISELAKLITAFEALARPELGTTVNVGIVSGGTAANTVPEKAFADIDLRVETMDEAKRIEDFVAGYVPFGPDIRVSFSGGINRPPYETTPKIQALFDIAAEVARGVGFELRGMKTGGGSDGNFTAATIATLDGLGADGGGGHTLEEYILLPSVPERLAFLRALIDRLGK